MRKVLLASFMVLVFLNIVLPIGTAQARSPKPEVWILGKPDWAPGPSDQEEQVIPWGISRINATEAWKTSTGVGVQIAVLDTGVDKEHEDLYVNIVWGISVVGDKESTLYRDWRDKNGHGTHVTGTIAAMNNDVGVVGVGYNISIYAIKVLNDSGFGTWEDLAEGIWWAIKGPDGEIGTDDDAEVICMSLGGTSYSKDVEEAVKAAYSYGIVLVAAAGNEGDDGVTYPAKFAEVIAVAAIDQNDDVPSWSSKGPEVELAAPGVNVLSTVPRDKYEKYSGTSMACPHVSGTVGLVLALPVDPAYDLNENGKWDPSEVRKKLQDTADDIGSEGWDSASGYGVVRADKAVATA